MIDSNQMSQAELALKNVSVSLGGHLILDNINLEVGQGELFSLLGPSGCGKSTMLKTIAGLIDTVKGDICIGGRNVNQDSSGKRGAVIVFQDLRLFPNMTVEENVAYPLKLQGVSRKKRTERVEDLLKSVRLEGYAGRSVHEMSGGQLQRVALARAIAASPKILLLDEPFSSLDENLREDMRRLVLDLHRLYDMTTILVTHDQQEALMMSDRIAVMENGRVIQCDKPQIIYNQPANKAVADYFGGGNYIPGEVAAGIFSSLPLQFPVAAADGSYAALFRPTALKPVPGQEFVVLNVSYLGDRLQVRAAGMGQQLIIAMTPDYDLKPGDSFDIEFDLSKVIMIAS